jgi:hypothetical protein
MPPTSMASGAVLPVRFESRHGAHTKASAAPISSALARVSVP